MTDTGTNVLSGQKIQLTSDLAGPPGATPPAITNYVWRISDYAISNFVADVNTGQVYTVFAKTNSNCDFYWVDGGAKQARCTVTAAGKTLSASAAFNARRPGIQMQVSEPAGGVYADSFYLQAGTYLHCGYMDGTNEVLGYESTFRDGTPRGRPPSVQWGTSQGGYLGADGTNYVATAAGVDNENQATNYVTLPAKMTAAHR